MRANKPQFDIDHYFCIRETWIRITYSTGGDLWLVCRYADPYDEGCPRFTYKSSAGECPQGPDLDAMIAWVYKQVWSRKV